MEKKHRSGKIIEEFCKRVYSFGLQKQGFTPHLFSGYTQERRQWFISLKSFSDGRFSAKGARKGLPRTFLHQKGAGFTIIELMIAALLFALLAGAILSLMISSISAQRKTLSHQTLIDQSSFVAEYMSRALRQAQQEPSVAACLPAAGHNYEITRAGQGIRFLDIDAQCREIYLDGDVIKETIDAGAAVALTSDKLEVLVLEFSTIGETDADDIQPRVTFFMDITGDAIQPTDRPRIQLQTTISQRHFDIVP